MTEPVVEKIATPIVAKTEAQPDVKVEPSPETPAESKGVDILEEPYITNPFFYEVTNYFGIDQPEFEKSKDKLSTIVEWAHQEAKSKKPEDILSVIRKAEDAIQPPQWGEKRYINLYRYIRLASQKQSVQKAMHAFERNSHE